MRKSLIALGAVAILWSTSFPTAPAAPPVSPAVEALTQKGLVKKGNFWVLADEAKTLDTIKELPQTEKKCRDAQTQFGEIVVQGKAAREQYDKTRKEYEQIQTLLKEKTPPQQQNTLSQENNKRVLLLQKLEPVIVDLTGPKNNPALTKAAAELSIARFELISVLSFLQDSIPTFETKYGALHDDPDVAAALKELGPGTRLGPARNYKKEPPKTAAAEKLAYSTTLPLYREEQRIVFDVVLNEKLTFAVSDGRTNDFTLLPAKAIESAGQKIADDAQQITLNADSKAYKCRLVKLNSLRLGKYLLKDVEVVALPDDAGSISPTLGRKTLADYELTSETADCKITIKSNADAAKDRASEKKAPAKPIGPPPALPKA